ncbi:MAG: hypothetical protein ABJE95_06595 [Byssovorax sp.]
MLARTLLRSSALALSLAALVATPGCGKKDVDTTTVAEGTSVVADAVTEDSDAGSITWSVTPEGKVVAALKSPDGKPITKDVAGTLTFREPAGDAKVPATFDEKTGLVTASGPKLDDDLTQIDYALTVAGKPWTGTMQVPRGGTKSLADDAKVAVAIAPPADKTGPNGGVIQVVGKDRLEIVADKGSGQVRVYVLDPDLHPVVVGDRKIRLALAGEAPEIVVLTPDAKGLYCTGRLVGRGDPTRITVSVSVKEETHAAIVGWSPGAHLLVGARAPRVHILVASWGPPEVDGRVKVDVHGPVVVVHDHDDDHGPIVVVHDHDHDDHGNIDIKVKGGNGNGNGKGNGKGKGGVSVKVH